MYENNESNRPELLRLIGSIDPLKRGMHGMPKRHLIGKDLRGIFPSARGQLRENERICMYILVTMYRDLSF